MKRKEEKQLERWTFGYTKEQYKRFNFHGILFLILFSCLYCCIYCMRQNVTYGGQYIIQELGWSKAEIGILTSTLFWTYGFGHLINGRLSERVGPPKFIIMAVLLSFTANMCMGAVGLIPNIPDLFGINGLLLMMAIVWGINGYFQSMAWTSGVAVITNWWPSNRRGTAVGFANAFTGLGSVLASVSIVFAMAISGGTGLNLGWKAVFFFPALIPLLMLIIYLIFAKTSPEKIGLPAYVEQNATQNEAEDEMKEMVKSHGVLYPYIYILTRPKFLIFVAVAFLTGVARYGMTQWVPFYFSETYQVSVKESLFGSLALPVGMAFGTLVVPFITDKLCPTNRMPAVIVCALLAASAIVGFLPLNPTNPIQLVLIQILLFIAGFGIYAVSGIVFTYATDIGGRVFSATASGILDFSEYMGAAIQSIVYGFVFDLNSTWVFYTMVIFCLVNAFLALIGARRKKAPSGI